MAAEDKSQNEANRQVFKKLRFLVIGNTLVSDLPEHRLILAIAKQTSLVFDLRLAGALATVR